MHITPSRVISNSDTALNTPLHEFQSFFTFSDTFFCHQRIVENFSDPIFSQPKPLSLRTTLIFFSPAIAFLELKELLLVLPTALIGSLEMNFFISLDLSWKLFSCLWKHPFCIIGATRVILLLGKRKRGSKFSSNFVQVRSQSFFHFLLSLAWHV